MIPSLASCLVKWKEGAWGGSSRYLDRISPHGWQIPATWPWAAISGTHHTDMDEWKEKQSNCFKLRQHSCYMEKAKKNSTILVVTKHRHTMCAYTFKFDCCLVETAELMANNFVTFSIKLNPRTQKKGKIICQIIPDHLPRKEERQKAEGGNGSQRGEKQFKGVHLTSLEFLEGWWRDFKIF